MQAGPQDARRYQDRRHLEPVELFDAARPGGLIGAGSAGHVTRLAVAAMRLAVAAMTGRALVRDRASPRRPDECSRQSMCSPAVALARLAAHRHPVVAAVRRAKLALLTARYSVVHTSGST